MIAFLDNIQFIYSNFQCFLTMADITSYEYLNSNGRIVRSRIITKIISHIADYILKGAAPFARMLLPLCG